MSLLYGLSAAEHRSQLEEAQAAAKAAESTLDTERRAFKSTMDKLQVSVKEMSQMMERTLTKNRELEEQLAKSTEQLKVVSGENRRLESLVSEQGARLVETTQLGQKEHLSRIDAMDQAVKTIDTLKEELNQARGSEIALERQLQAVKSSMREASNVSPSANPSTSPPPTEAEPRPEPDSTFNTAFLYQPAHLDVAAHCTGSAIPQLKPSIPSAVIPPSTLHRPLPATFGQQFPHVARHLLY